MGYRDVDQAMGVRNQPVDELSWCHRGRESCGEGRTLHKLIRKGLLIILQHCLPTRLAHDYALSDQLRVRQKLVEARAS